MKKTMKMLALAMVMILSGTAFAQGPKGDRKQKADSTFAVVSARLKLTAEQQVKLKETMQKNREEMKAVRESVKGKDKAEKRKAMLEQLKKNDERINALLNDAQKAEYAKLKEEKKAQLKARRAARNKDRSQHDAGEELADEDLL